MKNISVENIIKLMSMPKIGRKTALKLIQEITFNISNDNDLIDFINEKGSSFRLLTNSLAKKLSDNHKHFVFIDLRSIYLINDLFRSNLGLN